MSTAALYQRRLHHHETDSDGVCHFSNYLRIFEESFEHFTRGLCGSGLESLAHTFVVTEVNGKYLRPLRHGNVFNVDFEVLAVRRSFLVAKASYRVGTQLHACVEARLAAVDRTATASMGINPELRAALQARALEAQPRSAPESSGRTR